MTPTLLLMGVTLPLMVAFICRLAASPPAQFWTAGVQVTALLMCVTGFAALQSLDQPPRPWAWPAVCAGWFWVLATWPIKEPAPLRAPSTERKS